MGADSGREALRHALVELGGDLDDESATGRVRIVSPTGDSAVMRLLDAPKGMIPPAAVATLELRDELGDPESTTMVVADQIPAATRQLLNDAGISWFDRRGHLRVVATHVWIDADTKPVPRPQARARPRASVSGPAQITVAAASLLGEHLAVRALARRTGLSHTAISKARTALTESGLISATPAVPDLFWALADAWEPRWITLLEVPIFGPGLAATGTLAAIELGAGLAAQRWPVELLGADERTVETASLRAGVSDGDGPCRIAIAPTPLALADLTDHSVLGHRVVRPLFVALELAQDPARGREALEEWKPEGTPRVW